MKFFAYDDKMFSPLLHSILQEATCLGIAKVVGYKLYFHNRGANDPSGKCNLVRVRDSQESVYGVLYDVVAREKHLLDRAEALGYGNQEITLKVEPLMLMGGADNPCFAFTYVAHKENVFEDLVPFSWYKELVLSGAKEHHLPDVYLHYLQQIASTQDPNVARESKNKRFLETHLL